MNVNAGSSIVHSGSASSFPFIVSQTALADGASNTMLFGKSIATHNMFALTFNKDSVITNNTFTLGLFGDPQLSILTTGEMYSPKYFSSLSRPSGIMDMSASFTTVNNTASRPFSANCTGSFSDTNLITFDATNGWFLNISGRELYCILDATILWDGSGSIVGTRQTIIANELSGVVTPCQLDYFSFPVNGFCHLSVTTTFPIGSAFYVTAYQSSGSNLTINYRITSGLLPGMNVQQNSNLRITVLN